MSDQQKTAPQDIRNVADFLRNGKGGMKTRVGLWNGKRVDYFKGMSYREHILIKLLIYRCLFQGDLQ